MGHPTMQENDTAKLTPTYLGNKDRFFLRKLCLFNLSLLQNSKLVEK